MAKQTPDLHDDLLSPPTIECYGLPGTSTEYAHSNNGLSLEARDKRKEHLSDEREMWEEPVSKRGRKRKTEIVRVLNNPLSACNEDVLSNGSRVYVDATSIAMMHCDWPIHSAAPLKFRDAARIIVFDAADIRSNKICSSVPQEFTESGTFVVCMRNLSNRHMLNIDGLGRWGKAHGVCAFYNENGDKVDRNSGYFMKILCNRYTHPGTREIGSFHKYVYTGVSAMGEGSAFGVVCYQWEGVPHPIAVLDGRPKVFAHQRPFGQRMWEAHDVDLSLETNERWMGEPVFCRAAIDFDAACRILLGDVEINPSRIASVSPVGFHQCGTFLVDVDKAGGEKALTTNSGKWTKPSGSSRFFRQSEDGSIMRVDKGGQMPDDGYDLQVLSKRYDSEDVAGLVRKIFVLRESEDKREFEVNFSLAVITFFWKGDPFDPEAVNHKTDDGTKKRRLEDGEEGDEWGWGEMMLGHADQLKRMSLMKELENQNRLANILDRAEIFLDRFEAMGHQLGLSAQPLTHAPSSARDQYTEMTEGYWEEEDIRQTDAAPPGEQPQQQLVEEGHFEEFFAPS